MRSARADARSRIHRGMLKGITACARPKVPLGTKGVNTCYPVAKVFPSGWNENTSLYTGEKLAGGARASERASASDFNREPIYRSDAFLEFFTMLNYAVQTARNGIHNNGAREKRSSGSMIATYVEFVMLHALLMRIEFRRHRNARGG